MQMVTLGLSVEEMKASIDNEYSRYGPPTTP
jgi:hypothetical protein